LGFARLMGYGEDRLLRGRVRSPASARDEDDETGQPILTAVVSAGKPQRHAPDAGNPSIGRPKVVWCQDL